MLDTVEALLEERALTDVRLVPPRQPQRADVLLASRTRGWPDSDAGRAAVEHLRASPEVEHAQVNAKRNTVQIAFADEWVTSVGARLEAGDPEPLAATDLAPGHRVAVNFGNPNTTKALHVGHLRNIALGHAVASVARASGADVLTTSFAGDVGRSMGEAMAGYERFADGATPVSASVKSDCFVGDCYTRYVRAEEASEGSSDGRALDPALSREDMTRNDAADDLLRRLEAGDSAAAELWRRLRDWAVAGQDETLARLGVRVDRRFFESDFRADTQALAERGLAEGVLERLPDGAVVYATGRDEYPFLLLRRPDGFPTQHLRFMAHWGATMSQLEGRQSLKLIGSEWTPLTVYADEILPRLIPEDDFLPTAYLVHEMVSDGGRAMKSSAGEPLLIDDLLDEVSESEPLARLAERHERVDRSALAVTICLGLYLGRPMRNRMEVFREALWDADANPGWAIAQAWAAVWDPAVDGAPDPAPEDRDYRFTTVQAHLHRRFAAVALERSDPAPLIRFHAHLSRWFLQSDASPRTARALRTCLGQGLQTLGLRA